VGGFSALMQQKRAPWQCGFCVASDGYFQFSNSLIRGRIFDERTAANSPHVAVISESLARDGGQIRTPSATPSSLETWMATCVADHLGSWVTFTSTASTRASSSTVYVN